MNPAKVNNQIYYQKAFTFLDIFIMLHVNIVMFKKNISLYLFVFKIVHEIKKVHLMLNLLGKKKPVNL